VETRFKANARGVLSIAVC